MDERPDPGENLTRGQAHDDAVRVMDNNGITGRAGLPDALGAENTRVPAP